MIVLAFTRGFQTETPLGLLELVTLAGVIVCQAIPVLHRPRSSWPHIAMLSLGLIASVAAIAWAFIEPWELIAAYLVAAATLTALQWTIHLARPWQAGLMLYLLLIGVGVGLLRLPAAGAAERLNWSDAFYTAVSAVTLTALHAQHTQELLSGLGQFIVIAMIQLGAITAVLLSLRIARPHNPPIRRVVGTVLGIETLGTGALVVGGIALPDAAVLAVVSFCNCVIWRIPSEPLATKYIILVMLIIGGLGWPVWLLVMGGARYVKHAACVIGTTIVILAGGTALLQIGQSVSAQRITNAEGEVPYGRTVMEQSHVPQATMELFRWSVLARGGGGETIRSGQFTSASQGCLMIMMAVGGGPGSAAGGLKVIAVMILAVGSVQLIRKRVTSDEFHWGAATLCLFCLVGIGIVCFVLGLTQRLDLSSGLWLSTSAVANGGFDPSALASINATGKMTLAAGMLLGRIGLLWIWWRIVGTAVGKPKLLMA